VPDDVKTGVAKVDSDLKIAATEGQIRIKESGYLNILFLSCYLYKCSTGTAIALK
jgi:hypothetical protein